MSHKLENIFKESLRNDEAAFNPNAWSAMEKRLDTALPVQPNTLYGNGLPLLLALLYLLELHFY